MAKLSAFRAVIFDMDGLLLDSERIARDAWQRAAAAWGFSLPHDVYHQVIGRNITDAERIFTTLLGADFPFGAVRQLRLQYAEDYIAERGMPRRPGATELVTMLHERAVPKAVATSTAREEAWRRLHMAELSCYFDVLCGGDDVAQGKPAPDLFLLAAERLGVSPEDCVVLEDSESGVRAATAAGMAPVLVPDLKQPNEETMMLAAEIFPSLHAVQTAISEVLNRRETS